MTCAGRIEFFFDLHNADMTKAAVHNTSGSFPHRQEDQRVHIDGPGLYAVIHSFEDQPHLMKSFHHHESLFISRGTLQDGYHIINVDAIYCEAFIVEDLGSTDGGYFQIDSRRHWSTGFISGSWLKEGTE